MRVMFYLGTLLRTIARDTAFQIALRDCSKEAREEPGYTRALLKKTHVVKRQKIIANHKKQTNKKNPRHLKLKPQVNGASLVAHWLRIPLPMQGTRVGALLQEDPTCWGTTKPMCHNYWACALEPLSHNYWARVPQLLSPWATTPEAHARRAHAPQQENPPQWEAHAPQRRVAPARHN